MMGSEMGDILKEVAVAHCGICLTELRKTINRLAVMKNNRFSSQEIIDFRLSWW
jgi:hypothetical protein